MGTQPIVLAALWLTGLAVVVLGYYLVLEIRGQRRSARSSDPRDEVLRMVFDDRTRQIPRSPAPYRIQSPDPKAATPPPSSKDQLLRKAFDDSARLTPRSPEPRKIQRLDPKSATTPIAPPPQPPAKPTPAPSKQPRSAPPPSADERKLIGLLHGDRAQAQRLIQSAGSADRALFQLLRDRQ